MKTIVRGRIRFLTALSYRLIQAMWTSFAISGSGWQLEVSFLTVRSDQNGLCVLLVGNIRQLLPVNGSVLWGSDKLGIRIFWRRDSIDRKCSFGPQWSRCSRLLVNLEKTARWSWLCPQFSLLLFSLQSLDPLILILSLVWLHAAARGSICWLCWDLN